MTRRDAVLRAIMAAIAVLAVALPAWVVSDPPPLPPPAARQLAARLPQRVVVPPTVIPDVEPVKLVDLSPDDARAFNASVPFFDGPNPAARPFRYAGGTEDLARATDCLAAAELYEAGDDAVGERAVAQVVLNRLRHPAFPKTVCGVVFEGSERSTGCQFTFTCDGALARRPTDAGWKRAREIAAMALAGSVYKPVGYATHYHTDWVVPYWQASLDKIAAVHTHLFFRWSGWWGTPPAFNRQLSGGEPVEAKLAAWSDAHKMGAALAEADAAMGTATPVTGGSFKPSPSEPDTFLAALDPHEAPDDYYIKALQTCGDRPKCTVMGWTNPRAMASSTPLNGEQIAVLSFSYLRDRAAGFEKALWNCAQFKTIPPSSCMKRQLLRAVPPPEPIAAAKPTVPVTAPAKGPAELSGVHRKAETAPAPTPSPVAK